MIAFVSLQVFYDFRSLFEDNFIRGSDGEGSSQRNPATDGSNSAKRHWKKRKQVENCRQRRRQRKKDEKSAKSTPGLTTN